MWSREEGDPAARTDVGPVRVDGKHACEEIGQGVVDEDAEFLRQNIFRGRAWIPESTLSILEGVRTRSVKRLHKGHTLVRGHPSHQECSQC